MCNSNISSSLALLAILSPSSSHLKPSKWIRKTYEQIWVESSVYEMGLTSDYLQVCHSDFVTLTSEISMFRITSHEVSLSNCIIIIMHGMHSEMQFSEMLTNPVSEKYIPLFFPSGRELRRRWNWLFCITKWRYAGLLKSSREEAKAWKWSSAQMPEVRINTHQVLLLQQLQPHSTKVLLQDLPKVLD